MFKNQLSQKKARPEQKNHHRVLGSAVWNELQQSVDVVKVQDFVFKGFSIRTLSWWMLGFDIKHVAVPVGIWLWDLNKTLYEQPP